MTSDCVTVPNLVETVAGIRRFFLFFKMVSTAILNFEMLTVGRVKRVYLRHHAKFRDDPSNCCHAKTWRFFPFSKRLPQLCEIFEISKF